MQGVEDTQELGIEPAQLGGMWAEASRAEIYRSIDENANLMEIEIDGKRRTLISEDFGNCLCEIENFMAAIYRGGSAFSEERTRGGYLKPLALAKYLGQMTGFLNAYCMGKVYSPRVDLFYSVCITKYGLLPHDFSGRPDAFNPVFKMKEGEFFNELVQEFFELMSSRIFKRKLSARTEAVERGMASCAEYVNALYANTSRLLVLRIDFGFRTPDPTKQHPVSLAQAQEYMTRFMNNKRGKALYKHLEGYIWRLEYGQAKGHHFHLILFFDGAHVHKDGYLASEVGADWIRVTDGKGIFYNCNAHKQLYKRVGIGMISHDDDTMRRNLLDVLGYMHKEDQMLREKFSGKTKCWSRGVLPKVRSSNVGRPRRRRVGE